MIFIKIVVPTMRRALLLLRTYRLNCTEFIQMLYIYIYYVFHILNTYPVTYPLPIHTQDQTVNYKL